MSYKELITTGRFKLSLDDNELTTKQMLHQYLGKDFQELIDKAFIFNDTQQIQTLTKLALERVRNYDPVF